MKSTAAGVTLAEVLIATGILTVLMTIAIVSLGGKKNFENIEDITRKSDVNQLFKTFVRYYVDNHCYPSLAEWNSLTCDGPVPDALKPYMVKLPCDPETHQPYYYEPLDAMCHRCYGACGACTGFRILAKLKQQKDRSGVAAGCDQILGCDVNTPDGTPYTYGVSTANDCSRL